MSKKMSDFWKGSFTCKLYKPIFQPIRSGAHSSSYYITKKKKPKIFANIC